MFYADKRQQFLVDQGYSFQVIEQLPLQKKLNDPSFRNRFKLANKEEQNKLMAEIHKRDPNLEQKLIDNEFDSDLDVQEIEAEKKQEQHDKKRGLEYTGAQGEMVVDQFY